jgi:hypothetical protein
MTPRKRRNYLLLFCLTAYAASLTQPAIVYLNTEGPQSHSSRLLLFAGAFVPIFGGMWEWMIWLANPLFILVIVLLMNGRSTALYFSIAAAGLALSVLGWHRILSAESAKMVPIVSLEAGYWLWAISITVLAIGNVVWYKYLFGARSAYSPHIPDNTQPRSP